MDLLDFQRATVEHIMEYYKAHNVYLLADETGLGKTVIASEVVQRLCKDENGDFLPGKNVLYIASNLELARKNVNEKLAFDGANVVNKRLSILWKEFKKKENDKIKNSIVNLFALTPEVSLKQGTNGIAKERRACEIKWIELHNNKYLNYNNTLSELDTKILKLNQIIYSEEFKNLDLYKFNKYYCEFNELKNKKTKAFYSEPLFYKSALRLKYNMDDDFENAVKVVMDMYFREHVWRYMEYEINKPKLEEILKLNSVKEAVLKAKSNNYILNYYIENLWEDKNNSVNNNSLEIPDEMVRKIAGTICIDEVIKEIKNNEKIRKSILCLLLEMYKKEYYKLIRTYLSFYSLTEYVKPDIVVIDEIQNYPEIFTANGEVNDENSQIIKLVIDMVINRGGQTNQKILMLSATPYAYRNAIEIEVDKDEVDELGEFTKHLVGLEDILAYMTKSNGSEDNKIVEQWKNCQEELRKLYEAASVEEDSAINSKVSDVMDKLKKLSESMKELGISRTERPLKSYKPTEGKYCLNKFDIAEIADFYKKKKSACGSRVALSLPRNYECTNSKYAVFKDTSHVRLSHRNATTISSRVNAFLEDAFSDNAWLYLFIPPNKPDRPLSGVFANGERKYAKTVVFSAFNEVPPALAGEVHRELKNRLVKRYCDNFNCDKTAFEELIKQLDTDYTKYTNEGSGVTNKDPYNTIYGRCKKDDRESICHFFATPHAKSVLACLYGEKLKTDYWSCVDDYCISGNFKAVMDEFDYMRSTTKDKLDIKEYFSSSIQLEVSFCVQYTSDKGKDLDEKLRQFNSPFYPFVFMLTSVAEEGHDFHWYSDRIVHWNAPVNPIALLQREGRIDRLDCMAVRKVVAEKMKDYITDQNGGEGWLELFEAYKEEYRNEIDDLYKDMFPHFVVNKEPNPIKRMCYYYPMSGEYYRWEILMKNLEYYRSMFGACEQWSLHEKERNVMKSAVWDKLKNINVDLRIRRVIK